MNWVDQTNANRDGYSSAVPVLGLSTPSQVATRTRTRERSNSASYSYPHHQQPQVHGRQPAGPYSYGQSPYDNGDGDRRGARAPPQRIQPTRSKTMDFPPKDLHYSHAHVYDDSPHSSTHSRSRSSSRNPSPPRSSHVSSRAHTPHHSRSSSKVTTPVFTTAPRQYPYPSNPPPTTQPKSRHVRSSSADPPTRTRSYSYTGSTPLLPPPRPIPIPTPVPTVLPPTRQPRRSNTMPTPPKHVESDRGRDRHVLTKSYDYIPGVGTGHGVSYGYGYGNNYGTAPPGARVEVPVSCLFPSISLLFLVFCSLSKMV